MAVEEKAGGGPVERTEFETLFVEKHVDERYAVVTLHRPDKLNAGSPTLFHELGNAIKSFDDDDGVRAVVVTGGDGRAFSAGADLGGMTFDNARDTFWFIRRCHEAFEPIETLPKIVIAAVNGYAFGFGLELTLACDLVIASDAARFSLREMNHGLLPSATVTRGIDVLGRRRVAWLAFTSDDMTADEACAFGLVNKVVPHEELRSAYEELAVRMAKRPPLAVAMTKRLLNVEAGPDYRMAENFMPAIFGTQDVEEGRKSFEERREPVYEGN
jgi:enoyl-CoA hydratase/carnithine racemase